jgi:hypothetical protein
MSVLFDDNLGTLVQGGICEAFNTIYRYKAIDVGMAINSCCQYTCQAKRTGEELPSGLICS